MAEELRYHILVKSCNSEYTVADINSDVVEWQAHPRDICSGLLIVSAIYRYNEHISQITANRNNT